MKATATATVSAPRATDLLIRLARSGEQHALHELVLRQQQWIYRIALKMTCHPQDAEDVAQDAAVILLTKFSYYREQGNFRAWLFRIVSNLVRNRIKRKNQVAFVSIDRKDKYGEGRPCTELPDPKACPVEWPLALKEIRRLRLRGVMLCLDRRQRLIFILGEYMGLNDITGSALCGISRVNYRKKLSRARKRVRGFVREHWMLEDGKSLPKPCIAL